MAEKSESKRKKAPVAPAPEESTETELTVIDGGDSTSPEVVSDKKDRAQECVKRLRDLRDQATELFIEVSSDIYEVHKDNLFIFVENPNTGKPYESFKEFVEAEVDYGVRKAHYLVNLWQAYVIDSADGELTFLNEIRHLGSSKLILLTEWLNPETKDEWLEIAENKSCRQLEQYIKRLEADDPGEEETAEGLKTEQATVMKVQLFDDQLAIFNEAARLMKEHLNLESKGEVLAALSSDYVSKVIKSEDLPAGEGLKNYLTWMEKQARRQFGGEIRITAFDQADIVYGNENIEAVLDALSADDEDSEEF